MVMATKADWSELPNELLNLISKRIDNEIDLTRFRSICINWRSSSIPNHHRDMLTINFPLLQSPLNNDSININRKFCRLYKHSCFLIKQTPGLCSWIVKITQYSTGQTQERSTSPFVFDFSKISVLHLATNFVIPHFNSKKVVAVMSHGKKTIIVGSLNSTREEPVVLKCGYENWKFIPEMSAYLGDIRVFKGQPYVVDKTGWTVTVGQDGSNVQLVAVSLVGGGDIKFLVESDGDLLLADVYDRKFKDREHVRIDVFKLNEKEKKWMKLANIGDRVFFLGLLCSFSASASDLCVPKGNCVIIMDNIFTRVRCERSFLDLDDGRLLPLSNYPKYSKLFLPSQTEKLNL
jgi:hypothetical protein